MFSTFAKRSALLAGALLAFTLPALSAQTASAATGPATLIDAGGYHACAITSSARLKCWGYNVYGQLGLGDNLDDQSVPQLVPGLDHVKKVSTGDDTTCAIVGGDGKLKCWGYNGYGQIGDGTKKDRHHPVVTLKSGVKTVDFGVYHTCATLTNGHAKCWGTNSYGQIGDGTDTERLKPRLVEQVDNVKNISAGYDYTCATTSGGAAKCWGYNEYGQLGDGGYDSRKRAKTVTGLDKNVKTVQAGYYHTCAIVGDGRLKCWGNNSNGEIGAGDVGGYHPEPTNVVGMATNVKSVDPDYYFTCARQGQKAKCFGWNYYGELGTGDTDDLDVATVVKGLDKNVVQVTTAYYHACALLESGHAKCWGFNDEGELGSGDEDAYQFEAPQDVML
jgi:alpha-tubulin suppressor-like RCC1 family protein